VSPSSRTGACRALASIPLHIGPSRRGPHQAAPHLDRRRVDARPRPRPGCAVSGIRSLSAPWGAGNQSSDSPAERHRLRGQAIAPLPAGRVIVPSRPGDHARVRRRTSAMPHDRRRQLQRSEARAGVRTEQRTTAALAASVWLHCIGSSSQIPGD
jgi:hypothetical protein